MPEVFERRLQRERRWPITVRSYELEAFECSGAASRCARRSPTPFTRVTSVIPTVTRAAHTHMYLRRDFHVSPHVSPGMPPHSLPRPRPGDELPRAGRALYDSSSRRRIGCTRPSRRTEVRRARRAESFSMSQGDGLLHSRQGPAGPRWFDAEAGSGARALHVCGEDSLRRFLRTMVRPFIVIRPAAKRLAGLWCTDGTATTNA